MAFTSSYTPGLIQQSEYYYGTPEMTPGLSGSFSGSFQGDGSALTGVSAFPFTGDAIISGSLEITGSGGLKLTGPLEVSMTASSGVIPLSIKTISDLSTDTLIQVRDDGGSYDLMTFDSEGRFNMRGTSTDSEGAGYYVSQGGVVKEHAKMGFVNGKAQLSLSTNSADRFKVFLNSSNTSPMVGLEGRGTIALGTSISAATLPNEPRTNTMFIKTGTAPSTAETDNIQFFAQDVNGVAGTASPTFLTEDSQVLQLGVTSSLSYVSASAFKGDGSQLTNLPAASAGSTSGRVVFTTTDGALTTEAGFTYDATTNRLTVPNLTTTTFTSSFITSSQIHTSGSNIFGDDTSDTQTLIGTTKMTGSAQISGSLKFGGNVSELLYTGGKPVVIDTSAIGGIKAKGAILLNAPADSTYNSRILFGTSHAAMSFGRLQDSSAGIRGVTQNYAWQLFGIRHGYNDPGSGFHYTTDLPDTTFADNLTISGSGTYMSEPLKVHGSGSKVFEVIGTEGTLFSVDDDLDGTLLDVKDKSGIPVLQASASGEIYLGQSPQSLYTTAVISSTIADVTQSLYGLDTSSYGGAFFDYTAHSGSNARGGTVSSVWTPGGSVVFSETTTTHIGDTSNLNLVVHFSQSQAQLACYADTDQYNIKVITRAI